jgi:DNA-directed RNA polymerase specialized sigma24 family protein
MTRNRFGYVISAIVRFHGEAVAHHYDDAQQIVSLACLVHADDDDAVRMAKREFRRWINYRRPKMLDIAVIDVADGFNPVLIADCALVRLWPILDRLQPDQREALVRCEIDDIPRELVAEELGVTNERVGRLIRMARQRMRRLCEIEGIRP